MLGFNQSFFTHISGHCKAVQKSNNYGNILLFSGAFFHSIGQCPIQINVKQVDFVPQGRRSR